MITKIDLTQLSEIQLAELYVLIPAKKEYIQTHRDIFRRLEYLMGKFEAGELIRKYENT